VQLFPPEAATRVRWDNWPDTPLPTDTAAGQNPPDGAVIDYYLQSDVSGEATLDIRDERGRTVRHYSSTVPPTEERLANAPEFWFAPPAVLSTKAGLHRFVWNLQWEHPDTLPFGYSGRLLDYTEYSAPDHAILGQTPRQQPPGPYVVPGRYEVVLTIAGETHRQPLVVKIDPRVSASPADLQAQLDLARQISDGMASSYKSYYDVAALTRALAERRKSKPDIKELTEAIALLEKQLAALTDGTDALPGFGPINRDLARYLMMIESGDMRPAQSARTSAAAACEALRTNLARWRTMNSDQLPALNKLLQQNNLAAVPLVQPPADPLCVP
jgi:hypothetical protein